MRAAVSLDFALFDAVEGAAESVSGDLAALRSRLAAIVSGAGVFATNRATLLEHLEDAFELPLMVSPEYWEEQSRVRSFLELHLAEGIALLSRFLPSIPDAGNFEITVHPVPGFSTSYGAADKVQVFALHGGADPEEALLFLVHVCYHEVSSALYSEASRRAAESPDTPERFRHWLLLLIQNEGIANYAVLNRLTDGREASNAYRYFTYAPLVGNVGATTQAMTYCRETLGRLDDASVAFLRAHLSTVLKNPALPVINLVGIHIAQVVARVYGERMLLDVAGREPQELFRLYLDSGDELVSALFGPDRSAVGAFQLGDEPAASHHRVGGRRC